MNEQSLFEYLKQNYWKDLEQSEDKFSSWDCFSKSTNTRIELKCRKKHYSDLMIEKSKYYKLIKKYIEDNEIPLYINSTPNGIFVFDLREINPIWITDNKMPKTTEFNITAVIEKTYSLININKGKKIN
jgi:hypothetical protein